MRKTRNIAKVVLCMAVAGLSSMLFAGVDEGDSMAAVRTAPENGSVQSRPPQSLRVWLPKAPDVDKSNLELVGPTGKLKLQGLHTMGHEDLMVRIVGKVVDGEYKATWTVEDDGKTHTGEWTFTVKRGG